MEKMNDLRDLLKHEIEDLYSVEEQIIDALPKMIEKANNKTLKASLTEHLKITEEQKKRLDKIRGMMNSHQDEQNDKKKKGFLSGLFSGTHVCKGMKGIIEEGNKVMAEDMNPEVLDAAIIACAQKVEHYEITSYGTARSFARELSLEQVAQLLEKTLNEEYEADDWLTELAVTRINEKAENAGNHSGDRSASGTNQRENKQVKERAKREVEMETASTATTTSKRTESKNSLSSARGGQPKATGANPRTTEPSRSTAPQKKSTSATAAGKASGKTSGRTGNGRGSSSGRGRK